MKNQTIVVGSDESRRFADEIKAFEEHLEPGKQP